MRWESIVPRAPRNTVRCSFSDSDTRDRWPPSWECTLHRLDSFDDRTLDIDSRSSFSVKKLNREQTMADEENKNKNIVSTDSTMNINTSAEIKSYKFCVVFH